MGWSDIRADIYRPVIAAVIAGVVTDVYPQRRTGIVVSAAAKHKNAKYGADGNKIQFDYFSA